MLGKFGRYDMLTETFHVRVSLPLKSVNGSRAEATFLLGETGEPLSQNMAIEVKKILTGAFANATQEAYVSIVKTSVDDGWRPEAAKPA